MVKKAVIMISLCFIILFSILIPVSEAGNQTIPQLQKKIFELSKQVKALTDKLNQNTKEITTQKKKISDLESKIKSKDKIISKKEMEIENLNNLVYEYELEIETKKIEIKENEQNIDKKTKTLEIMANTSEIIYTDSSGNIIGASNTAIKWYGFKTEQANMYLTKSAIEKFGYIIETSDNIIKNIAPYFNVNELPSKVSVYIWVDEPVTKTNTGEYFSRDDQIFINGGSYSHQTTIIHTYIHELTHAFQDLVFKLFTHENYYQDVFFITEGMANYVTFHYFDYTRYNIPTVNIYDKNTLSRMVERAFVNLNLDKEKFTHLPPTNIKKPWMDYSIYEGIIYYLEDNYGHERFVQFVEYQKYLPISESLFKAFGVSEEELIKDWKKYFGLNI
jgi:hypothetical protein